MGGNERNENNRIVLNEVSLLFSLSLSTCLVLVIIAGCALSELASLLRCSRGGFLFVSFGYPFGLVNRLISNKKKRCFSIFLCGIMSLYDL